MRKLDARFESIWRAVHSLQMDKVSSSSISNYANQHQINHLEAQIVELKKILIQAGILVEPTDLGSSVHQLDEKLYAVRKVK